MNVVSWFEIPVKDMKRARTFYTKVLGHIVNDLPSPIPDMEVAGFSWEQDAPHATGALVKGEGRTPHADNVLVYFQCRDDLSNELGRGGGERRQAPGPQGAHRTVGLRCARARHRGEPYRAGAAQLIEEQL